MFAADTDCLDQTNMMYHNGWGGTDILLGVEDTIGISMTASRESLWHFREKVSRNHH